MERKMIKAVRRIQDIEVKAAKGETVGYRYID